MSQPSIDLLRDLARRRSRSGFVTAYAPVGSSTRSVEHVLAAACRGAHGPPPTAVHLSAVVAHLCESLAARAGVASVDVRSIACFADIDGSVQDDVWVPLPVSIPLQARVAPSLDLAPFVGALDRMCVHDADEHVMGLPVIGPAAKVLAGAGGW